MNIPYFSRTLTVYSIVCCGCVFDIIICYLSKDIFPCKMTFYLKIKVRMLIVLS